MLDYSLEAAFRAHLASVGMDTDDAIVGDGNIRRFHIRGDKPGRRNGAYRLFCDGWPAGWALNWRTGHSVNWKSGDQPFTDEERQQIERRVQRRREKDQRRAAEAADRARAIWQNAREHKTVHPYFQNKALMTRTPICQDSLTIGGVQMKGAAVIPMHDAEGRLASLQLITCEGKKFLPGAPTGGLRFVLGEITDEVPLLVCEGVATGLSLSRSTGYPACVAFDAGNLPRVARSVRDQYPTLEIIIAADNDQWTDGNPGVRAARAAADAVTGVLAIPEFRNVESRPTDFDDLRQLEGEEAVARIITAARASSRSEPDVHSGSPAGAAPEQKGEDQDWPRTPSAQQLDKVVAVAPSVSRYDPAQVLANIATIDDEGKPRAQAHVLIDIGCTHHLFHDEGGDAYAAIPAGAGEVVLALNSNDYRELLARDFYRLTGKGANRNALTDAVNTLSAKAKHDGPCEPVFLRIGGTSEGLTIDLGDDRYRAIEVTPKGWQIVERAPVRFRRSGKPAPLPLPLATQANIALLWKLLNIAERDRPLVLAWLLGALSAEGRSPSCCSSASRAARNPPLRVCSNG